MVSVCHHYSTSDCQAVSHVSQAFCSSFFLLCPICLSSLYPPSLFPGSCLYILSMLRLLLHLLFHLSIHLPVFLVSSSPSWCAVSFPPLHFSTFRVVIKRLAPPAFLYTLLFLSLHHHMAHPCYSRASVICRVCMLNCTCAGHKGVLVSAKQATNIFFFVCESSLQPVYSFCMLDGFSWCDAFPQEVLFYFIFLFTDVIGCLLFAATLRLCSCPC